MTILFCNQNENALSNLGDFVTMEDELANFCG
jgi:hypothetical protein